MSDVKVLRPGRLTTVQDDGYRGWLRHGVSVGGAVDRTAMSIANLLVGNERSVPVLEATLEGPSLQFSRDALVSVCGPQVSASVNGTLIPDWRPVHLPAGQILHMGAVASGCRTYVAVAGGFNVDEVLGSRSTYLYGSFGGMEGRPLLAGDEMPIGEWPELSLRLMRALTAGSPSPAVRYPSWAAGPSMRPAYSAMPIVRVVRGPDYGRIAGPGVHQLWTASFRATPDANRMGVRLTGTPIELRLAHELLSKPITCGTIQVTNDGQLVVLLADGQTTGGYPNIGQVVSADIPVIAQLRPGDRVRFRQVSLQEAHGAWKLQEMNLRRLAQAVRYRL